MDPVELLEGLRQLPPWWVYTLLFGGALLEYIFPPFPGDTLVVVGAALVVAFGWSVPAVFLAVTGGSVAGGMIGFAVGVWLERTRQVSRLGPKQQRAVEIVVQGFARYGAAYLAINRFLPGVRSFFFVAAGLAGLRAGAVLAWSTLAAAAWNGLLIGVGVLLGGNVERLAELVRRHNTAAGAVVLVVLCVGAWRLWRAVRTEDERPPVG